MMVDGLYMCDPNKHTMCKKTHCMGVCAPDVAECFLTSFEQFAVTEGVALEIRLKGETPAKKVVRPIDNYDVFSDRVKSLLERWDRFHAQTDVLESVSLSNVCISGILSEINDNFTQDLITDHSYWVNVPRTIYYGTEEKDKPLTTANESQDSEEDK